MSKRDDHCKAFTRREFIKASSTMAVGLAFLGKSPAGSSKAFASTIREGEVGSKTIYEDGVKIGRVFLEKRMRHPRGSGIGGESSSIRSRR